MTILSRLVGVIMDRERPLRRFVTAKGAGMRCLVVLTALLAWGGVALGADGAPPAVYAIQLESSRQPDLSDYAAIEGLGRLYTYRPRGGDGPVRVRLGYYGSREEGEAVLARIRALGFSDAYLSKVKHPGRYRAVPAPRQAAVRVAPPVQAPTAERAASAGTERAAAPPSTAGEKHPPSPPSPAARPLRLGPGPLAGDAIPDPFAE